MLKEGSTNEDLQLNGIHHFSHNRKEIGLVVNTVKTQYCMYSCLTTRMHNKIKDSKQTTIKCAKVNIYGNGRSEYCFYEETMRKFNLENVCYHTVQNLLHLVCCPEIQGFTMHNYNVTCVTYGYATWCLRSKDKHTFSIFKNRDVRENGQAEGTSLLA